MELNKVLDRVHKLIAKAEDCDNPQSTAYNTTEAESYRKMADALMLKYAIEEAALDATRPAAAQMKPETLDFPVGVGNGDIDGWLATLAISVSRHCRCKIRNYVSFRDGAWQSRVYGYASDIRYFEMLWTTIRLHMTGVLCPSFDPALSLDDNAYALHEAGRNWLEIAVLDGWVKVSQYSSRYYAALEAGIKVPFVKDDEVKPATHVGGIYKSAYYRAVRARGEQPTKISAGGSKTFRYSAAQGYVGRIGRRLRAMADSRESGGSALALRFDAVEDAYREATSSAYTRCPACEKLSDDPFTCDRCGHQIAEQPEQAECPRCKAAKSGYCRAHAPRSYRDAPFSRNAYERGVNHANTADLGTPKTGSSQRRELS